MSVELDQLAAKMNIWRKDRPNKVSAIPAEIWDDFAKVAKTHSWKEIREKTNISQTLFKNAQKRLALNQYTPNPRQPKAATTFSKVVDTPIINSIPQCDGCAISITNIHGQVLRIENYRDVQSLIKAFMS